MDCFRASEAAFFAPKFVVALMDSSATPVGGHLTHSFGHPTPPMSQPVTMHYAQQSFPPPLVTPAAQAYHAVTHAPGSVVHVAGPHSAPGSGSFSQQIAQPAVHLGNLGMTTKDAVPRKLESTRASKDADEGP